MTADATFPGEFTLADVASLFTAANPNFNYFHGKLYSFIPPEPQKFMDFSKGLRINVGTFPNAHPATVVVGKLGNCIPIQAKQVMAVKDGRLNILAQISELKLPDCDYLAIISPIEKTGSSTNSSRGFESINFLRSLIALPFGKLPFYTWIADFDFDSKGVVSLPGETVRMPLHGDLFKIFDFPSVNEILARLALQQADYRKRLQRACNFFDLALDQRDEAFRFSSYWIALEIIVGGKSDAIRSKLASAYQQRNKKFADDNLLFREIEGLRNRLIHHGEFGVLASYQERLMQLYFWDIVIHQIGLKSRGFAKMFVGSGMVEVERNDSMGPTGET